MFSEKEAIYRMRFEIVTPVGVKLLLGCWML